MTDRLTWEQNKYNKTWCLYHAKTARHISGKYYTQYNIVMYLLPDYRLSARKRVFIGWRVAAQADRKLVVLARIWQLKKAQDFAEVQWRLSR